MDNEVSAFSVDNLHHVTITVNPSNEIRQQYIPTEEEPEKKTLSGIADRPYCKGRAYDPNRYGSATTEE